jgi:transposase
MDMSMGSRRRHRPEPMWIPSAALIQTSSHPFYSRLNQVLDEGGFDAFVESLCAKFYAASTGRPGLAPGVYFRSLLIGYFEGIDSERGIAWRAGDSLTIRSFLGIGLDEAVPDHTTISRTRRLVDLETHQQVFGWVLRLVAEKGLLKGKTIGVDATTLEANAALRSIVRRDTGEAYQDFLKRLAKESGIETPTREQLAKLDRKRPKKGSNEEWQHPNDPDARITKMKDGRTHLAHKAEHAVDLETGAVVEVTIAHADQGDAATLIETLAQAGERIAEIASEVNSEEVGEVVDSDGPANVVADKGYHSNDALVGLQQAQVRSYVSEPDRGRRNWDGKGEAKAAVYGNRRRIRGERGKALLRRRGEFLERSFAHAYETGGMRRTHLRGSENISKRVLIHIGAFNLGLIMRKLMGRGTPRGLQDSGKGVSQLLAQLTFWLTFIHRTDEVTRAHFVTPIHYLRSVPRCRSLPFRKTLSNPGC